MGQFDVSSEFFAAKDQKEKRRFDVADKLLAGGRKPETAPVQTPTGPPVSGLPPESQSTIIQGTVGDIAKPKSEVLAQAAGNFPESALQVGSDTVMALVNLPQTVKSVYELSKGVVNLAIPGEHESEETAKQVGQYFVDRYGSFENVKKTFAKDPAGMLLDLSVVAGIGGALAPGKFGSSMQKMAAAVDPLNVVGKGLQVATKIVPSKRVSGMYQRAVKFSSTIDVKDTERLARTALNKEIMPTIKGLEKLDDGINELNSKIAKTIDKAVVTGKTIPVLRLMRGTKKLMHPDELGVMGETGRKAVIKVRKELADANKRIGRTALTPAEAQKLKQTTYRLLQKSYDKDLEGVVSKKAQMAVAKEAKKAIEEIVPEVKALNKADGDLIALRKAIDGPVKRISKQDILSFRPLISAGTGGVIGGWPVALAGLTLGVLSSPKVQAKFAIVVNKLQKKGITINPNSAGVRLGLIEMSRTTKKDGE